MRVVSSLNGSSRERIEVKADLLPIANWRIVWADAKPGFVRASGRHLVMSSRWGPKRSFDLWLTEEEAVGVATAVLNDLLANAAQNLTKTAPDVAALSAGHRSSDAALPEKLRGEI